MITRARLWELTRIWALPAVFVAILASGLIPLEKLFLATPHGLTASIAASDVASLTNEERIKNGLPPLAVSALLTEAAQQKADDMAANSYYAHVSPDGKTPLYWLNRVGYRYLNAGENLIIDRTTSEQAVTAWMNSPEHRENILRPQFTQIGIGVAKGVFEGQSTIYVVQEFGKPYPTATAVTPKPAPAKVTVATPAPAPVEKKPVATPKPTTAASVPAVKKVVTTPHIATLTTKPAAPAVKPAPAAVLTEPIATTTQEQGSSTVSYTLAPEFFTPVTLSAAESARNEVEPAAPQGVSESRLSIFISQIKAYLRHIFSTAG